MFQSYKFVALFVSLLFSSTSVGQVVQYDSYVSPSVRNSIQTYPTIGTQYYPTTTYTQVPTQTYSAPIYTTPTYSTPTYSTPATTTSYYGQVSTPVYNNPNVRFRDPSAHYSNWYGVAQPSYSDYRYDQRFDGPNERYARAYNAANGYSYRNGFWAGRGGMSVVKAVERDDLLRGQAFTQSRGFTFSNGLIRGAIGMMIRPAATGN